MYYKVEINETCRNSLKDNSTLMNTVNKNLRDKEEVEKFLIERYSKLPKGKNKIFIDTDEGPKEIGFTYSYWNSDFSHNSNKWFQTDWITITKVFEEPVLLSELI